MDTLVQDYRWGVMAENGNRFKKIVYEYDLISGKVNKVAYQPGQPDAFYHVYFYDAENRITHVQTSADSINWDNDAFYQYYDHGPLARTILGEQQVQGIHYAYTLHGWLKAINPTVHTSEGYTLQPDGSSGSVVAAPAYDILLNYYNSEYTAISGATPMDDGLGSTLGADHRPLFNGNISSMGVNITALTHPLLYNYQYDQLNRLVKMDAWHRIGSAWSELSSIADFAERIRYDANGNIIGYKRNGNNTFAGSPLGMDSLSYKYITGTNQLEYVRDSVPAGNYSVDIDNQDAGNYGYDAIGNMTSDEAEGISKISWTVYGKISRIEKAGGKEIFYTYDAGGNRISKRVNSGDTTITTWYVRDAQGNVMSVYTAGDDSVNNGALTQTELHLYGSSRLGMFRSSTNVQNLVPGTDTILPLLGTGYSVIFIRGKKLFELSNHLGNVLVTISDKKMGVSVDDSTVEYFVADIMSAQDYYPFGMVMPGREFGGKDYRYGFNGKENDWEAKGWMNQVDYGMRVYDPRVGRFLSVDPKAAKNAHQSPYSAMNNNPIIYTDPDGGDGVLTITGNTITIHSTIYVYGSGATQAIVNQMQSDIMRKWGTNSGKAWTYTDKATGKVYNVQFDVSVKLYDNKAKSSPNIIPEAWDPDNRDNFIEVGASLREVGRSYVTGGDEGEWRGVGRSALPLAKDDPAPHEFGHLVGLKDRYTDANGPDLGWGTNIMGDSQNGIVEQRNIDALVSDGVKRFNVVQKELSDLKTKVKATLSNDTMHYSGTGVFKYEIDIDKPNK